MSLEIRISRLAEKHLESLINYLEINWPEKVKIDFLKKLDNAIETIKLFPEAFPLSKEKNGLHKFILTPHNTIYYRIEPNRIEIVLIFDSRQNPKKVLQK